MKTLRFSSADVELFARASHDRNPLHLSEDHAHRSPFGERVVFGVLGALGCLGRLTPAPDKVLVSLTMEFQNAIFVDVEYRVDVRESADAAVVRLFDGPRVILKVAAKFAEGVRSVLGEGQPSASRTVAGDGRAASSAEGAYFPDCGALAALMDRFASSSLDPVRLAALLACSYVVGMVLPGTRALFARASLEFPAHSPERPTRIEYEATAVQRDERFGLTTFELQVRSAEIVVVRGQLAAFVRPEVSPPTIETMRRVLGPGDEFRTKTAVVVGGSRGLGAWVALAIAARGGRAIATYRRSDAEADALAKEAACSSGDIEPLKIDAADGRAWSALRERLSAERRGVDLLVLGACPALTPLWIDQAAAARISAYVSRSVEMVVTPMAWLLPAATRGAVCVVVSSSAVTSPVAEWPHYMAAKGAIESLVAAASVEYRYTRFMVARPPRLLTDLTNTPMSRTKSLAPEVAAAAIVRRVLAGGASGAVDVLEDFEAEPNE